MEDSHPGGVSSNQAPGNADAASSTTNQRAMLGAVPLTVTKRATVLKDHEDEIFDLWQIARLLEMSRYDTLGGWVVVFFFFFLLIIVWCH